MKKQLPGQNCRSSRVYECRTVFPLFLGGSVDIRTYDTQDNLNSDLSTGRIDAGLADYSLWQGFLESDGRTVELYGPQVSGGLFGPGVGIGVRKDNLSLVKPFDDALVSIKADGTLKAISDRWFNADLSAD
jgi:octopine/nopaline transport system substrate-binding protein